METFEVTGPHQLTDLRGRKRFEDRATLESRSPFDADTRRLGPASD